MGAVHHNWTRGSQYWSWQCHRYAFRPVELSLQLWSPYNLPICCWGKIGASIGAVAAWYLWHVLGHVLSSPINHLNDLLRALITLRWPNYLNRVNEKHVTYHWLLGQELGQLGHVLGQLGHACMLLQDLLQIWLSLYSNAISMAHIDRIVNFDNIFESTFF